MWANSRDAKCAPTRTVLSVAEIPLHGEVRKQEPVLGDDPDATLLRRQADALRRIQPDAVAQSNPPLLRVQEAGDETQDA
jgi:hypothetical protein